MASGRSNQEVDDPIRLSALHIEFRLDETPAVLGRIAGCPNIGSTGPEVQHNGLRQVGVESLGLGIMAGAMLAGAGLP